MWWAVDWFCNVGEKCGVRSTLCFMTSWRFPLPCSLLETQGHSLILFFYYLRCPSYGQKTKRNTSVMQSGSKATSLVRKIAFTVQWLFFIFICILNRINSTNLNDDWRWLYSVLQYDGVCIFGVHALYICIHLVCLFMWGLQCSNITQWQNYYVGDLVLGKQEITAQKKKKRRKENIVCTYSKWQERRKQSSFIVSGQFGQDSFQNGDKLQTKNTAIIFNNWKRV